MILDTAFIIDLMDTDEGAIAKARTLETDGVPIRVPAMVVLELFIGVGYSDRAEREHAKIAGVLESKPIVPTDERIARHAGRLIGSARRDGTTPGRGDAVIAAAAHVFDEPVVSRNVADFEAMGVTVETY